MSAAILDLLEERTKEEAKQNSPGASMQAVEEAQAQKEAQPQTAPVATPEDAIKDVTLQPEAQPQTVSEQQAELQRQANIPEGWTDDEYEAVSKLYSDEQIQSIFAKPEAGSLVNGIYSAVYKSRARHPDEKSIYDEDTAKKQRRIASLVDVLSLLSEAYTGSKGAINQERKFEDMATGRVAKQQQQLYDRYLKSLDEYDRGLINAHLKDYQAGMSDWKETQKNIATALDKYRTNEATKAYRDEQLAISRERLEVTKSEAESRIIKREEDAETARMRAAAYVQRVSQQGASKSTPTKSTKSTTTGAGRKIDYRMVFGAMPGDPDAVVNELGQRVRIMELTKGELDAFYRDATQDEDFKAGYPSHFPQYAIDGYKHTEAQRRDIASAYAAEVYRQKYLQVRDTPVEIGARTGAAARAKEITGHDEFKEPTRTEAVTVKPNTTKTKAEAQRQAPPLKQEKELTQAELDELFPIVNQ